MPTYRKDPDATLDFAVDWSSWLSVGDTIATAAWTVPDGITQPGAHPATVEDGKATVWLTGGTVGQSYPVTCRVTTTEGRIDERTITIVVSER